MFSVVQLGVWCVFLLFLTGKITSRTGRAVFSALSSLFILVEVFALYTTQKFLGYQFFNHINLNDLEIYAFQFVGEIIIGTALTIILTVLFYKMAKILSMSKFKKNAYLIPVAVVSFAILSAPNGIINEVYKIYAMVTVKKMTFNKALANLNIPPEKYVLEKDLKARPGKNIVVICIESLEQGFLTEKFKSLTPGLNNLTKKWTYYDKMPQSPGGSWTAGSLYSYQVGVPAFFNGQSNAYFQGADSSKLIGLGNILNKADYNSRFLMGKVDYAGTADLLNVYGIPVVSEKNSIGSYSKINNGLHDLDLFAEARLQIDQLVKEQSKPFAIFLATINTHFPDGIYDKRMGRYIDLKEKGLKYTIQSIDFLIKDFLDNLKEKNLLEDTAVFIFPDHLLMGGAGRIHQKLNQNKRQLYLLTNVKEDKLPAKTEETIYQIDLPKMIVKGAEIKTNARFLADFITSDNIVEYLNDNRVKLTALNRAALHRENYKSGFKVSIEDDELMLSSLNNKYEEKIDLRKEIPNKIHLTSSECETSKTIKSIIKINSRKKFRLQRGLNLLTLNENDVFKVECFDTYKSLSEMNRFIRTMEGIDINKDFFAIVMNDAAKKYEKESGEKLRQLGLKVLPKLEYRVPYIAYNLQNGEIKEFEGETTISKDIEYTIKKTKDGIFDFTFNPGMVLLHKFQIPAESAMESSKYTDKYNRIHLLAYVENGEITKAYLGDKNNTGIIKIGPMPVFNSSIIAEVVSSGKVKLNKDKDKKEEVYRNEVLLTSSEFSTSKKIKSRIKVETKTFNLKRGLNLLTIDEFGNYVIDSFDTYLSFVEMTRFIKRIENVIEKNNFFAVVLNDATKKPNKELRKQLEQLGFKTLAKIDHRVSYIAYNNEKGELKEFSTKKSVSALVKSFKNINYEQLNKIVNQYRKDKNRFIAHAGCQIEKHKYTNSLEAMNQSYKNGFKLFELDIIKTSDQEFVAAHDWKHWARITGYKGELPPTKEIFKKQKIYQKYTPMDMDDINQWFKKHKDAILVTDKVNAPTEFAGQFVDKKRLKMELFTWKAVKEAQKVGILSPMPTGYLLGKIDGDKIAYLKKLGIKEMACSREMDKSLARKIYNAGINIYAFNLYSKKGKDEEYVICKEHKYFYGMYADKFDFNKEIRCSK
ncbi:MAG: interleukin-like EMT inducer domain-containing protein [Candidatus Rifleibacteriota bacterium]